jgi:hypothetical protein
MSVNFIFNSGESKRLDKPLANLLNSKGMGHIEGEVTAKEDKPPLNKASKVVKRRSKK